MKNIALLLVTLLIFFLIGEGAFKVMHLLMDAEVSPTEIADLPYENTPNGWFIRWDNGWILYKHNSLGMRDRPRSYERTDKTRVLCLGDSVTHGGGVRFNDMFTQQLEQLTDYEVWNCGTTSYGIYEYMVYLRDKGLKANPDIVVVGLSMNDYVIRLAPKITAKTEHKKRISRIFHSYLWEYIVEAIQAFRYKPIPTSPYNDMLKQESWEANRKYLEGLKILCEDRKLIVLIFPLSEHYTTLPSDMPQKYIKQILTELEIDYIDCTDNLNETMYEKFDQIHFDKEGHRVVAEVLAERIQQEERHNGEGV